MSGAQIVSAQHCIHNKQLMRKRTLIYKLNVVPVTFAFGIPQRRIKATVEGWQARSRKLY
jgi:hypothetical protein